MKKRSISQEKKKERRIVRESVIGGILGMLIGLVIILGKRAYFDDKYTKLENLLIDHYYSKDNLKKAMKDSLGKSYIEKDNETAELRLNFEQYMISLVLEDINKNENDHITTYNHFYTGEAATKVKNILSEDKVLTVEENGDVAIINMPDFVKGKTYNELKAYKEVLALRRRIVIDLRNNTGGSTDELRSVLSAFFDDEETVYTEISANGVKEYKSNQERLIEFDRMVILCNGKTISSAEALAHCMKSYFGDNVTIIGQQTYGKNFSYNIYKFRDGDLLTFVTAFMGDCKGETYSSEGIVPDIQCDDEKAMDMAMKLLQK